MPSKYLKLNDKKWLEEYYLEKRLSTKEIAKIVGAKQSNSVRQALLRLDIPIRNQREAQVKNEIQGVELDTSFIDGGLLGDAYLGIHNKFSKISQPYYCRKQKHKEYIDWCSRNLPSIPFSVSKEKGKLGDSFFLRTLSSPIFRSFFERWYPEKNQYKKCVPRDLAFDAKTLLVWFLDDGSTTWRTGRRKGQVLLSFSSESFSKEDNEFLVEGFNKEFDLNMSVRKCNSGTGWRSWVSQSKVKDFFSIIGDHPVECYRYKWKIG